jgi:hypothetical protein
MWNAFSSWDKRKSLQGLAYNISARTASKTPLPVSVFYIVSVETGLFAKPLLGNGCCIVDYFSIVA